MKSQEFSFFQKHLQKRQMEFRRKDLQYEKSFLLNQFVQEKNHGRRELQPKPLIKIFAP